MQEKSEGGMLYSNTGGPVIIKFDLCTELTQVNCNTEYFSLAMEGILS